jgi:hypothetical protein
MQVEHTNPGPLGEDYASCDCSLALLVEPDTEALRARERLLLRACKAVYAVSASAHLYEWHPSEDSFIAIVSDALGPLHMLAVTEYVRHRWPHARILIVGQAAPFLDDQLYDEALPALAGDEDFLDAVMRCIDHQLINSSISPRKKSEVHVSSNLEDSFQ